MNRKIDNLGRIVIPKEIRKKLDIKDDDELDIKVEKDKIIISKQNDHLKKAIDILESAMYPSQEIIDAIKELRG